MMSTATTASTTLPFVCIFFVAMIFHELAMESLTTSHADFEHLTTSITMFQFGFCIIVPLIFSGKGVLRDFPASIKELFTYIKLSAVVYGATALSTASLGFAGVSYVTKVVFKSSKLIPTMVVGVVMERAGFSSRKRSYSPYDYAAAVMLCLGAVGFAYSPSKAGLDGDGDGEGRQARFGEHGIGIALLSASVFCDAIVPNVQENLMQSGSAGHSKAAPSSKESGDDEEIEMQSLVKDTKDSRSTLPKRDQKGLSSQSLMVNTNSVGFSCLLLSTLAYSSFVPIVKHLSENQHSALMHLTVGCGLGAAVMSYMEIIKRSGPAVAVATATLRKVVTVILSYIVFPKQMTLTHIFSGILVAGGMCVSYVGRGKR